MPTPAKTKKAHKKPTKKSVITGGKARRQSLLNRKLALPFIILFAVIGVIFVFRSFAQTSPYRYSAYNCSDYNTPAASGSNSCVQASAHAYVYRAYKGVMGRNPDKSGYNFWSNELIAGRKAPDDVINTFVKQGEKKPASLSELNNADFVKLLYVKVLGYTPQESAVTYWKNQLDSGAWSRTKTIAHFAKTANITVDVANARLTAPDHKPFVTALYKNMFKRSPSANDLSYWENQIVKHGWSHAKVARHFANSGEAIKAHGSEALSYIRTNKPAEEQSGEGSEGGGEGEGSGGGNSAVPADARKTQEARTSEVQKINASTERVIVAMRDRSKDNDSRKNNVARLAALPEDRVALSHLQQIRKNNYDVIQSRLNGYKGKDYKQKVDANYAKIKQLHTQAVALSKKHPGLTHGRIDYELKRADTYRGEATRHIENAAWLLSEVARSYALAESKYEQHLQHEALRKSCQAAKKTYRHSTNKCYQKGVVGGVQYYFEWVLGAGGRLVCRVSQGSVGCKVPTSGGSGGGSSGGGGGVPANNPCASVRHNSSKDAIKGCQRYLGVSADGIWGQKTENAFVVKFGYASGWRPAETKPIPKVSDAANCRRVGGVWRNGRCEDNSSGGNNSQQVACLRQGKAWVNGKCVSSQRIVNPSAFGCPPGQTPRIHGSYRSCHSASGGYIPSRFACPAGYKKYNKPNRSNNWSGSLCLRSDLSKP